MSRHGGGISISLDDLLTLPERLRTMQQNRQIAAQQEQRTQAKFNEEEHQKDLMHAGQSVMLARQFGLNSPEATGALRENRYAKEHGVAGYTEAKEGNPWGLKPGDWLAHDANGNPLYEDQFHYDPDSGTTTMLETTRGEDPRTGQTSAPRIDPNRKPLVLTKEQQDALVRYNEAGGKPSLTGTGPDEKTEIQSNVPGVAPQLAPQEKAQSAYARYLNALASGQRAASAAAARGKNLNEQAAAFVAEMYPDPINKGSISPQGQEVFRKIVSDPDFRGIKVAPGTDYSQAINKVFVRYQPQAAQSEMPPWGDAAKAENTGATSPTLEKPKTLADEINSVDQGVAAAPGLKERAQQQKMKSVANQAQTYFMQHYKNIASMSGAGTLTRQQRVQQAIDQTMNEPNLQSLSPEYTKAVREQLLEDAMGTNPAPTPSPVPQPTPAAPTPTAAPAVPGRPTAMADQPDQQQQGFAKGGKVEKVMHEWKTGKLHSGSKNGPVVTKQKQAVAIALSEAGKAQRGLGFAPRSR